MECLNEHNSKGHWGIWSGGRLCVSSRWCWSERNGCLRAFYTYSVDHTDTGGLTSHYGENYRTWGPSPDVDLAWHRISLRPSFHTCLPDNESGFLSYPIFCYRLTRIYIQVWVPVATSYKTLKSLLRFVPNNLRYVSQWRYGQERFSGGFFG